MKTTVHVCLESMMYDATISLSNAIKEYSEAQKNFFENNGSSYRFRATKKALDEAYQRLSDLEATKRIITEMEEKGIEL